VSLFSDRTAVSSKSNWIKAEVTKRFSQQARQRRGVFGNKEKKCVTYLSAFLIHTDLAVIISKYVLSQARLTKLFSQWAR